MKKWLLWIIFVIVLCSGCKTTQTSTSSDTEELHVTVYDTTRVVNTYNVVDTTHIEYLNTTTTHTVEYYDPETGQLRQRVIDQQSNIQMLQDQLLSMQAMLDSMRTIRADTTHIVTHEEEKEDVVEKRSWFDNIEKTIQGITIGIAIAFVIVLVFVWQYRK